MNLGLENVRDGQLETGIAYYRQSLALVEEQLKAGTKPSPEFRATLLRQLSTHLVGARRHQEVLALFASPLAASGPLAASDHYAWGLAGMETGRAEEAAAQFQLCLDKRGQPDAIAVNTGIFTVNPHHCLALALARLNRLAQAEQVCLAAMELFPDSREIALFRAKLVFHQGRPVDALKALNPMLARWGGDPEIWLLGGEIALSQPQLCEFGLDWTGEAARFFLDNPRVVAQRVEFLLLAGAAAEASALSCPNYQSLEPRPMAAMIFAQVLSETPPRVDPEREPQLSRAFLDLCRRLIAANAADPIRRLNQRLDLLEQTLPTAARLLKEAARAC
jgi:tetratricopeptide (TPR) repeat protein